MPVSAMNANRYDLPSFIAQKYEMTSFVCSNLEPGLIRRNVYGLW